MTYTKFTNNLFSYPKFEGTVNLPTEEIEIFLDQDTRVWLEGIVMEHFNDRIKEISEYRIRPWSQVFKVETILNGLYFLKIPAPEFYQEAQTLKLIESFSPDTATKIIAQNKSNGSFLMAALEGDTLRSVTRKHFDQSILEDSGASIAYFQRDARKHVSDFEKLGIPKWTSKTITENCEALIQNSRFLCHSCLSDSNIADFKSLFPIILEKLDVLTSFDQGLSIDHGDFQDSNIYIWEGRNLFLDWADAVILVPSFTIGTYCHSVLLAHPHITDKPKFVLNILQKYYLTLLGFESNEKHQYHVYLVHLLYPVVCILKVSRLLDLAEKKIDKYASEIIDYWIEVVISFSEAYCDKSLSNKIT